MCLWASLTLTKSLTVRANGGTDAVLSDESIFVSKVEGDIYTLQMCVRLRVLQEQHLGVSEGMDVIITPSKSLLCST